jgi:thiol-disulfide isomerase/thioredoxin
MAKRRRKTVSGTNRYVVGLVGVVVLMVAGVLIAGSHVGASPNSVPSNAIPSLTPGVPDPDLVPEGQRPAAPEFAGLAGWLNSAPLTIASLRGRVVLIDFWTFSCVNCVDTLPYLRSDYTKYSSQGLALIGVHSPEFDFEKSRSNVEAAVKRLGVTWPVALDSTMSTWSAWSNQYWPAEYLIDKDGNVAYYNFGEGAYDRTERAIVSLLGLNTAIAVAAPPAADPNLTPELYAGSARGHLDAPETYGAAGVSTSYPDSGPPTDVGSIQVVGAWADHLEYLQATTSGHIRLRFEARDLYLVAESGSTPVTVHITLDGVPVPASNRGPDLSSTGTLTVGRSDLFHVLTAVGGGNHLIDLSVPGGFRIYTFTFE